jgi:hypothetical protein
MNHLFPLRALLAGASFLFIAGAQAQTMSATDASAAKDHISADYKTAKAACDKMTGNAKDVCVEEAKGHEKVAKAELEYKRTGKASDMNKLAMVRAEAAYEVAKERCDDKAGNDKDVCRKEAKAAEVKAKADAKVAKEGTAARADANADKREADYKVAAEKCDALAGDAKTACVDAAKSRFGMR